MRSSGMGPLIYDATLARDYPLLNGYFLVITICVLIANFLVDVAYAVLDPRVRGEQESIIQYPTKIRVDTD
jgi:peptide/nickel transport system permease protein